MKSWVFNRVAAVALVPLLLGGCAGLDAGPAPEVPQASSLAASGTGYRLNPGDSIKIVVFGEGQYSGDYAIDGRGEFVLPGIGAVRAAGLSINGLEAALRERLAKDADLENPQVSVLLDVAKKVQVIGEVRNPGEYPYSAGMTVASAVALAGGYSRRANTGYVVLKQANNDAPQTRLPAEIPYLNPGDVLRIPER